MNLRIVIAGAALALLAGWNTSAHARETLPVRIEQVPAGDDELELRIQGEVTGPVSRHVVLRIDDGHSTDYANRFNDERTLSPGPFSWTLRLSGLRASNKRPLDPHDLRQILLFDNDNSHQVTVDVFQLDHVTAGSTTPAAPAAAQSATRTLPQSIDDLAVGGNVQLRIEGEVGGTAMRTVVLRVDDSRSTDYASRVNDEHKVPPGPFAWTVRVDQLRTSNNRPIDVNDLRMIMLFDNDNSGEVKVSTFKLEPVAAPPQPTAAAAAPAGKSLPLELDPLPKSADNMQFRIEGEVAGSSSRTVVLRVDDGQSTNYASRVNDERKVPPGPFAWTVRLDQLRTSNNRPIDINDLRMVLLFDNENSGEVKVSTFKLEPVAASPQPTAAANAPAGKNLPLELDPLPKSADNMQFRIEGEVTGSSSRTVVLRVDDGQSTNYASRVNDERKVPPGPFAWTVRLDQLRTSNNRPIDINDLRMVLLFDNDNSGEVKASTFKLESVVAAPQPTAAANAPAGKTLPLELDSLPKPAQNMQFRIEGEVAGSSSRTVVLRVDDGQSTNYASRANYERKVQPGPFAWTVRLDQLRTSNNRPIDVNDLRMALLFDNDNSGQVRATTFRLEPVPGASANTVAQTPRPAPTSAPPAPSTQNPGKPRPSQSLIPVGRPQSLPIKVEHVPAETDDMQLRIEGEVAGSSPRLVILRIDDDQSRDYGSRVNDERMFPPGPFNWLVQLKGLRTINKRVIDHRDIRQIILFDSDGGNQVKVETFTLEPAPKLPQGVVGLSFGAANSPLFGGFERVAPGDPRIEESQVGTVLRPGVDPLIASGMRNIHKVRIPWSGGRARVSLWTEDVGEWEFLPFSTERWIRVNGTDVVKEKMTPQQWIEQRYLRGRQVEYDGKGDAWDYYGSKRGGPVTTEVEPQDGAITIELGGEGPAAAFLSAILIEPASQHAALDDIEARRRGWYRSIWRMGEQAPDPVPDRLVVDLDARATTPFARVSLAPGSGARLAFALKTSQDRPGQPVKIEFPEARAAGLEADLWAGQWRLARAANLLVAQTDLLRADTAALPLSTDRPRRFDAWITAADFALPGIRHGVLVVGEGSSAVRLPFEVEVLDVRLPPPPKPSGFYMDEAPHLTWFGGPGAARTLQVGCDLTYLAKLGIKGNAPPLPAPLPGREALFVNNAAMAVHDGTAPPLFAYGPARTLRDKLGVEGAATAIRNADLAAAAAGLPPVVWGAADEPSNLDMPREDVKGWITAIRQADPGVRLGAQFNSEQDAQYVSLFNLAIVNAGFGIDRATIARLHSEGPEVWVYNTGRPRLTAGVWLWLTEASRYLQWHARMPTADPFDPTDGREDDSEVFWPTGQVCPRVPDIHPSLLSMAEGVTDLRWLTWLDSQSRPEARALANRLRTAVGTRFQDALKVTDRDLAKTRDDIVSLARKPH
jgi:hypothetical protein